MSHAKMYNLCFNAYSLPHRLLLHSSYNFYILSALAFPGNQTHDLGVAKRHALSVELQESFIFVWNKMHFSRALPISFYQEHT